MYISCTFHVVCATFSALATRKSADAKADSSGIWALINILASLLQRNSWIGLNDPSFTGDWHWTDGSMVTWSVWYPNEPNGFGKEGGGIIWGDQYFNTYNDAPLGYGFRAVCEKLGR